MKNLLKVLVFIVLAGSSKAQVPNFTITNNSGTYTLTCTQTVIFFSASTNVVGPVSFHWAGSSFSITAVTATITQAGNYTVTALDSLNNVFGTQYFTVSSNTIAPLSGVSPSGQTITCSSSIGSAVTANTSSANLTHAFISPYGTTVVSSQAAASYTPVGPGTYTHVVLDNINGCQSSATFSLTSTQGYPTFDVSSPQNFTLGCNSTSAAVIHIDNGATSVPPGGPVSYSLTSSIMSPGPGALSSVTQYTITSPGLYYVIVKDNTSGCMTQIPLSILSNTLTPNISVTVPTQILSCDVPQVILHGSSTATNVSYLWSFMGTPGSVVDNTIQVTSQSAAPTMSLINTYTLTGLKNSSSYAL